MRIPSRYSISGYMSPSQWLTWELMRMWHAVPDRFVQPFHSDRRFVFVCGCGHSGTTLTAARLGNHSHVLLIARETYAFSPLNNRRCLKGILTEWSYFAEAAGKNVILEKTPKHVQEVERIISTIANSRIVITVRNPLDNVASLYKRFGDLSGAIVRWMTDNRRVVSLRDNKSIHIVKYEDMTRNPEESFRKICEFSGLPWERAVIEGPATAYDRVVQTHEHMRLRAREVRDGIRAKLGSWKSILSDEQAQEVRRKTAAVSRSLGYSETSDGSYSTA